MRAKTVETLVLLLVAAVTIWEGGRIVIEGGVKFSAQQAGGYVLLLGCVLAALAIAHLFEAGVPGAGDIYNWGGDKGVHRVAIALAVFAAYVFFMDHLGYLLATVLFGIAYTRIFGGYRWVPIVASCFAGAIGAAYLWAYLGMTLPHGVLPWP